MAVRIAAMYARQNDFVIQPQSRTTAGVWIGVEPVRVMSSETDMATVARHIRFALAASQEAVAHPSDWKAVLRPLLDGAQVRSWNALQRSAKLVEIETSDAGIRVLSTRNGGASGGDKGFHSLPETAILLGIGCSDDDLGSALSQAMALCC